MIPERYETPITQIRETPITQIRFAADPGRAIGLDRAWARGFAFGGKMKARLAARERMVSQSGGQLIDAWESRVRMRLGA